MPVYYIIDNLQDIVGLLNVKEDCTHHSRLFYHIKLKKTDIYHTNKYTLSQVPVMYDLIVIGAGPAGISTVYEYKKNQPYKTVLLIEEGPPASEYQYTSIKDWMNASNDPKFIQLYNTSSAPLQVGLGIGGSSNIFGLQFVYDDTHFPHADIQSLQDDLGIRKYGYTSSNILDSKKLLKTTLESNTTFETINNLLYATGENLTERVLYSNLLKNLKNVDILTYSEVQLLNVEDNIITGVSLYDTIFKGKNYVLTCGALGTPELLLKSNIIQSGEYLLNDHLGFSIMYEKPNDILYDEYILGNLQSRHLGDDWQVYFSLLPMETFETKLVVTYATSRLLDDTKKVYFSLDNSNHLLIDNYSLEDGQTYGTYKSILKDAFVTIDSELINLGFNRMRSEPTLEQVYEKVLEKEMISIYHYQSTLADKVVKVVEQQDVFNDLDNYRLLNGPQNLFLGDLATFGSNFQHFGSTSAVAAAQGLTLASLLKKI